MRAKFEGTQKITSFFRFVPVKELGNKRMGRNADCCMVSASSAGLQPVFR